VCQNSVIKTKNKPTVPDWIFVQKTIRLEAGTKRCFHEGRWSHTAFQLPDVVDWFAQVGVSMSKCTVWPVLGTVSFRVSLVDTGACLVVANVISTFRVAGGPV